MIGSAILSLKLSLTQNFGYLGCESNLAPISNLSAIISQQITAETDHFLIDHNVEARDTSGF